jgi:TfoX/Sxy family transcriptional regulator of competence genes
MTYNEDLASRVRELLRDEGALGEREMFGGVAFLLEGNMSVGISGDELIVRVGPEAGEHALGQPHARAFDMTGRPMKGWVMVAPEGVKTERQLATWVGRGVAFARTLPAKR